MDKTVYCYYHRIDLDGHCSAAIVRKWAEEQGYKFNEMPIDHSDGLEMFDIYPRSAGLTCIGVMVDFCAPIGIMKELNKTYSEFIWIDHHVSAIKQIKEAGLENIKGLRATNKSACELCLNYFFPNKPNDAVSLLGRYDIYDDKCEQFSWEKEIMPFQLAMRVGMKETLDKDLIPWDKLLKIDSNDTTGFIDSYIQIGKIACKYDSHLRQEDRVNAYNSTLDDVKCICVNSSLRGSQTLENICREDEMMVVWRFNGKKWIVGLYSRKDSDIDCSKIAGVYKGGGHKNAAGFILPGIYSSPLELFKAYRN